jgi:hypothetical protein
MIGMRSSSCRARGLDAMTQDCHTDAMREETSHTGQDFFGNAALNLLRESICVDPGIRPEFD